MSEVKIAHDGGPAFPSDERIYGSDGTVMQKIEHRGMSLRDWFAGMALQGLIAGYGKRYITDGSYHSDDPIHQAKSAYRIADAMLKARETR